MLAACPKLRAWPRRCRELHLLGFVLLTVTATGGDRQASSRIRVCVTEYTPELSAGGRIGNGFRKTIPCTALEGFCCDEKML